MNDKLDWFLALIRIAGATFPASSSLVQLHAEIDSMKVKKRLIKLEDPISYLHKDIPELSNAIYRKLKEQDSTILEFSDQFYTKYSKPLALLDSRKYIKTLHAIGNRYQGGISLNDPTFILYLCVRNEKNQKMQSLYDRVEECEVGEFLDGYKIDIDLPMPVIKAVFKIYESNGYGICSKEIGSCFYRCVA